LPGGAPGITASVAAQSRAGHRVIAFDIELHSISAFTASLRVSERGGVVVLTDDRKIIGAPGKVLELHGITPQTVLLKRPEDIGWALATNAAEALRGTALRTPVRFKSSDEPYWGQARTFPLSAEQALFVAVVVPEADLLGTLPELRFWGMAIIAVVLLFAVLQAFALARRYSRPIEALVEESDRISRGDFEHPRVIDTSVSEVRRLADAHDRMRAGLKSLMRLERDLMLARQIQQNTFPDRLPVLADFDIDAFSEPAEQTGGDSYDVVARPRSPDSADEPQSAVDPERVVMLLSDVTGHGIGSALSAVQVRAMLRMAVRIGADLPTIARHLNDQLSADLFGGRFITAWLGELDAGRHSLTYFSAGQAPLIHYRAASDAFHILDAEAPPFGITESMSIEPAPPLTLEPGDIFAVFSDGVFESPGPDGERFGQQRILRIIEENCRESGGTILLELRKALADFEAGTQPTDDQTAVIIKRT
jgi:serine phosphatase RsbU (regulator of sigma subunit)